MSMNSHSPEAAALRGRIGVRLRWERRDAHVLVTLAALFLTTVAFTMAIVGLPPVDIHGPLHRVGIMDPFCGGTRAARYAAQGQLAEAWRYNPLGILVVAAAVIAVVRAALGLIARRWLNLSISVNPRVRRLLTALAILLFLLLAVRQQMHADLLMAGTWTLV